MSRASTMPVDELLFLARIELMTNPTITTYTMRDGKEHNRRAVNPWAALTDSMGKFASAAERAGRTIAEGLATLFKPVDR